MGEIGPSRSAVGSARWTRTAITAASGLLVAFLLLGGAFGAGAAAPVTPAAGGAVFLNVSATPSLSFVPTTLSVEPGQSVHLIVTQLATFNHTFTLSSVANFTFPSTDTTSDLDAFFATHAPLVNLSLGPTMDAKYYANFTAPPQGSYEYVCLQNGHFTAGMHGELESGISSGSGGAASATLLYLVLPGVVILVVLVAFVLLFLRRNRPRAPPG